MFRGRDNKSEEAVKEQKKENKILWGKRKIEMRLETLLNTHENRELKQRAAQGQEII